MSAGGANPFTAPIPFVLLPRLDEALALVVDREELFVLDALEDHRSLFTGDTIFLRDGEWVAAVLDFSDRERYLESLELLRDIDSDVLVPCAATNGGPFFVQVDGGEAKRRIGAIIDHVRRGERH
jgi:hypothetical protein